MYILVGVNFRRGGGGHGKDEKMTEVYNYKKGGGDHFWPNFS